MEHRGTRILQTQRLVLRPFRLKDAREMFHNWACDPVVTRYLTWPAHSSQAVTEQVLRLWIEGYASPEQYQWAIEEQETGRVIGSISLLHTTKDLQLEQMEVGYVIGGAWWNRGLMTEAAKRLLCYGFEELGLHRIKGIHHIDNPASGRVMEKIGMTLEGTIREGNRDNCGRWCTVRQYAALRTDPPLWRSSSGQ